jgi:hypothetical protein
MNQQKQNILIVETKDGAKYQGIYVSRDIQKQIITLSNVKKTFQEKEELLPMIEISKETIASINIIDIRPPREDIQNVNQIPENKKNVIDENKLANVVKAYDKSKDDFFNQLKPMTNPEVKKNQKIIIKKIKIHLVCLTMTIKIIKSGEKGEEEGEIKEDMDKDVEEEIIIEAIEEDITIIFMEMSIIIIIMEIIIKMLEIKIIMDKIIIAEVGEEVEVEDEVEKEANIKIIIIIMETKIQIIMPII